MQSACQARYKKAGEKWIFDRDILPGYNG